jgi:hypothetical protein
MAFGAGVHDKALGHADEHLQLSFQLAYQLSEAKDLQEACEIQGQFLVQRLWTLTHGKFKSFLNL